MTLSRRSAQLPLHGGRAPHWLFERMSQLAGSLVQAIVLDYGPEDLLRRLSDPGWFQAFGCALGFDWHSSGLTTVTCGALKDAYRRLGDELGVVVAGGKGAASRKTPRELAEAAARLGLSDAVGAGLIEASRLSAKVDSAAVQDGFALYHHTFVFAPAAAARGAGELRGGPWCVVQQGMDQRWARRYHWLGEGLNDPLCDPHAGLGQGGRAPLEVLNLVAAEAAACRERSAELVLFEDPDRLTNELERISEGPTLFAPAHHPVLPVDVDLPRLRKLMRRAHEAQPRDFQALLTTPGVGAAAIRALALLAELIHGAPPSREDLRPRRWADMSYAHGGKDGHPFPVDRRSYDHSIATLSEVVHRARAGEGEKAEALRRLARLGGAPLRVAVPRPPAPAGRAAQATPPAAPPAPRARSAKRAPRGPRQLGLFGRPPR